MDKVQKTYLITGGAGFIGTNLAEHLTKIGEKVIVVDDLSSGKKERLPEAVVFHKRDICDTKELTKICKGVDVAVHLAALPRVQFSIDHPLEAQHVNVDGTLSVLEAAKNAKVGRVVFAASSSAYGDQETLPLPETLPAIPKSPYALHKYMGEHMMRLWHEIHGIETVSLRFFNIYGPHMDPDGPYALVIGRFLKMRLKGESMTITGDGEQTRDFTHTRDLVEAIVKAGESNNVGKGEVLNVGSGRNVSINELTKMIGGKTEYIEQRIEPKHTRADIARIQRILNWNPVVTIEEGIDELKKEWKLVF